MPRDALCAALAVLLPASKVAEMLNVTPPRVWTLAKEKKLNPIETPLGLLYDPADVNRLIKERAVKFEQMAKHLRAAATN